MCIGVNDPLLAPRDLDDLLPLGPERTGELKEDFAGATERDGGDGGGLFEDKVDYLRMRINFSCKRVIHKI